MSEWTPEVKRAVNDGIAAYKQGEVSNDCLARRMQQLVDEAEQRGRAEVIAAVQAEALTARALTLLSPNWGITLPQARAMGRALAAALEDR